MRALAALVALAALTASHPQMPDDERRGREALGRAAKALRVDTLPRAWVVSGHGRENLGAELQGRTPDEPTWRPHRETVAVDRHDETVSWHRWTPRNDDSIRDRAFIYGPAQTLIVDYANRFSRATPGEVPVARRRALTRRIPHLLIADLASRNASDVRWIRSVRAGGEEADEIAATLPSDGRFVLTIGRTGALHALAYDMLFPGRGNVTVRWAWEGWRPHASHGLAPAGHRIEIGGDLFQDVAYTRYEASAGIAGVRPHLSPELPPPAPMTPAPDWTAAAGPAAGEVAPGVHIARIGGFTILFADIGRSIVAFEAPEPFVGTESIPATNREAAGTLSPQVIAHIRKTIPGKPISHVVISHHHGDHAGGIEAFRKEGAQIVTREMRIGEGDREIHVINTGPNPHTDDNLVLWIPGAGVMIQGDLFYFDAGAGFQPGRARMNRFFAGWLRARGLRPRMLYGVHNTGAAGPAALDAVR